MAPPSLVAMEWILKKHNNIVDDTVEKLQEHRKKHAGKQTEQQWAEEKTAEQADPKQEDAEQESPSQQNAEQKDCTAETCGAQAKKTVRFAVYETKGEPSMSGGNGGGIKVTSGSGGDNHNAPPNITINIRCPNCKKRSTSYFESAHIRACDTPKCSFRPARPGDRIEETGDAENPVQVIFVLDAYDADKNHSWRNEYTVPSVHCTQDVTLMISGFNKYEIVVMVQPKGGDHFWIQLAPVRKD